MEEKVSRWTAQRALEIWAEWQTKRPAAPAISYKPESRSSADSAADDPKIPWTVLQVHTTLSLNPRMARVAERLYFSRGVMPRPTAHRLRFELWDAVALGMERDAKFDTMSIADAAIAEVRRSRRDKKQ